MVERHPGSGAPPGGSEGYEKRDTDVRAVTWFLVILFVATLVSMVAMKFLYGILAERAAADQRPPGTLVGMRSPQPPEPRLQPAPFDDLIHLRAAEEQALSSYGWVDRSKGVVRIPIERAIDLIVERGIPPAPPTPPAGAVAPAPPGEAR